MKQTTLWIIIIWNQLLLGMKKRWFGKGLWNGPWGKQKSQETIEEALIRETKEETDLDISSNDMKNVWVLHFYFEANPEWDQDVHLYKIQNYNWAPAETEEIKPEWFDLENIPYDQMWEDDYIWLPRVLKGETVEYNFYFGEDDNMKNFEKIR